MPLGHYIQFVYGALSWKQNMGQWADNNWLRHIECLIEEMKNIISKNKSAAQYCDSPSNSSKIAKPRYDDFCRRQGGEKLGWSFHLQLYKEGSYLFLYDCEVTCIQKVHITCDCSQITRNNIAINGHSGSPVNIRFHGRFSSQKVDNESNTIFWNRQVDGRIMLKIMNS